MARFLSQTLNLITTAFTSAAKIRGIRRLSAQPESPLTAEPTKAWAWDVEALEDSIYSKIIIGCKPKWVPLVPGASYWIPPRTSCGVSELARSFSNKFSPEDNDDLSPENIRADFKDLMKDYCEGWAGIPVFFLPDSTSHVGYKTFCLIEWEYPDFTFLRDDDTAYFLRVPDEYEKNYFPEDEYEKYYFPASW